MGEGRERERERRNKVRKRLGDRARKDSIIGLVWLGERGQEGELISFH